MPASASLYLRPTTTPAQILAIPQLPAATAVSIAVTRFVLAQRHAFTISDLLSLLQREGHPSVDPLAESAEELRNTIRYLIFADIITKTREGVFCRVSQIGDQMPGRIH